MEKVVACSVLFVRGSLDVASFLPATRGLSDVGMTIAKLTQ